MGLELVELTLRVEEEFDISISDAELEKAQTPKDLSNIIYRKYQAIAKNQYHTQTGFNNVKKIFVDHFGFKEHQLQVDTKLKDLFQKHTIKQWKKLNTYLQNTISYPLKFSKNMLIMLWIMSLSISLVLTYKFELNIFFTIMFCVYAFFLLSFIFRPFFANQLPQEIQTLSDLIRYTGGSKKLDIYQNEKEILDKVIEISIDVLGLKPEEIHPDSRYIDDLGAD